MRQLVGGIPRAFTTHRTPEGALYGRHCRAWAARFGGTLPDDIRPMVRLSGRLTVEIEGLEADYDRARSRRRLTEARRIRRQLIGSRAQFLKTQERLETRAVTQVTGALRAFAGGEL